MKVTECMMERSIEEKVNNDAVWILAGRGTTDAIFRVS